MTEPHGKLPYPLLVVDDRADVLQALTRYFELEFEHVFGAQTVSEAEEILRTHSPTFLLCDYWLGDDTPPSTTFLPRWRREYPSLKRVVLMTGTKSTSIPPCPEVDVVLTKPLRMADMVEYFELHGRSLP
jgi:DNA-binding NtrC family response regulator